MVVQPVERRSRRIPETVKTLFALPVYQIIYALEYAGTYERQAQRILGFLRLLPAIAVSTLIWFANWFLIGSLVSMFVR